MQFLITLFFLLVSSFVSAQSPAYSIVLQLKDTLTPYSIEMKFCKPKNPTRFTNWFAHDTSKIRWEKLGPSDYTCGEYFTSYYADIEKKQGFKAANQRMVWEDIIVFKITSAEKNTTMYILVPVFIQSFVTTVRIENVPFKQGIYELDDLETYFKERTLIIQNNKGQNWIERSGKRKYQVDLR